MGKFTTEIKWGLIFVASLLLWMVFERLVGLHDEHIDKHMIFTNFFALIAFFLYYKALSDKRDNDLKGQMSYGEAIKAGIIMTLVVTICSPATQYVISTYITPDYFNNVINYAVASDYMTLEEAEAYFNLESYIKQSLMFSFIMGVVTTLIMGFFTKTKATDDSAENPSPEESNNE